MRRAAIVLLAWGVWLGALTALQAVFAPKVIQFSIPAAAAAACVTAGLVLWALDVREGQVERPQRQVEQRRREQVERPQGQVEQRRREQVERPQGLAEQPRLITDSSPATVTLIAGLAVALLGAGFGLWLILIGAGVTTLGLGGVVREQRARTRTLRGEGSR